MIYIKTLRFEGSSDDTFGEYGVTYDDVDNCGSKEPIHCIVKSSKGRLIVTGVYKHPLDACWTVGVSQYAEDEKIPKWNFRYKTAENGYSPILEVDVPDDTEIEFIK